MDEDKLIRAAQGGDRDAMGMLFATHYEGVRRLIATVIGPDAELDDITQDVFIQAFISLRKFRKESSLSTWLHRIAVHCALSRLRGHVTRRKILIDQKIETHVPVDAESNVDARRMLRRLYDILDAVSPLRRVAFTLFEIEGRAIEEVAAITNVSQATAKSRIWFARREVLKKARKDMVLLPLLMELKL